MERLEPGALRGRRTRAACDREDGGWRIPGVRAGKEGAERPTRRPMPMRLPARKFARELSEIASMQVRRRRRGPRRWPHDFTAPRRLDIPSAPFMGLTNDSLRGDGDLTRFRPARPPRRRSSTMLPRPRCAAPRPKIVATSPERCRAAESTSHRTRIAASSSSISFPMRRASSASRLAAPRLPRSGRPSAAAASAAARTAAPLAAAIRPASRSACAAHGRAPDAAPRAPTTRRWRSA